MTSRRYSKILSLPFILLLTGFLFYGCDDNNFYEPDLSTVPEPRDTTGVERIEQSNGLVIYIHQEGDGQFTVSDRDIVAVRYTGRLTDGGIFDSSWIDGRTFPREFNLANMIAGFRQGLVGMKEGGIRTLVIPASLGYGSQPPQGSYGFARVSPGDTLIFEIELEAIMD